MAAEEVRIRLLGIKKTIPTVLNFPWAKTKIAFDKDGFASVPVYMAERIKKEAPQNFEYPIRAEVGDTTSPKEKKSPKPEKPIEDKTKEFVEAIK